MHQPHEPMVLKHVDILQLPLLGVAMDFATANRHVTHALNQVYGHWKVWNERYGFASNPEPRPRIRIALAGVPACKAPLAAPRIQLTDDRLVMRGVHLRGSANLRRRTGHVVISPALLDDFERFRADAVDTLALAILTQLDRTPIHASAIGTASAAVAFAGPSGIGKSTLADLGQQAGYEVIADEAVYVQTEPTTRLWGFGRAPRPRPTGSPNGPKRIGGSVFNREARPFRDCATLCVLRRDGPPEGALEPITPEQAANELLPHLDPGFDRFALRLPAALRALAVNGLWRFYLPIRPDDARRFFEQLLGPPPGRIPRTPDRDR